MKPSLSSWQASAMLDRHIPFYSVVLQTASRPIGGDRRGAEWQDDGIGERKREVHGGRLENAAVSGDGSAICEKKDQVKTRARMRGWEARSESGEPDSQKEREA